jgi:hypothetical protein
MLILVGASSKHCAPQRFIARWHEEQRNTGSRCFVSTLTALDVSFLALHRKTKAVNCLAELPQHGAGSPHDPAIDGFHWYRRSGGFSAR